MADTFQVGEQRTVNLSAGLAFFRAQVGQANNALNAAIRAYCEAHPGDNDVDLNEVVGYAKTEDMALPSTLITYAAIPDTLRQELLKSDVSGKLEDGFQVKVGATTTVPVPTQIQLGSVTLYHWSQEATGPDSKDTWDITYDDKAKKYSAQRLTEKNGAMVPAGDPITGGSYESVARQLTDLTKGKEGEYSVEFKDANGIITKKIKSMNEQSNINWTKEQKDMQKKQWRLQLYNAILDLLKNSGAFKKFKKLRRMI